jgi:hypothetical protein
LGGWHDWPEIPEEVVAEAVAFKARLSTPEGLAAYEAQLGPDAQARGRVVVHHNDGEPTATFAAVATYDVPISDPDPDGNPTESFDENGNP